MYFWLFNETQARTGRVRGTLLVAHAAPNPAWSVQDSHQGLKAVSFAPSG